MRLVHSDRILGSNHQFRVYNEQIIAEGTIDVPSRVSTKRQRITLAQVIF